MTVRRLLSSLTLVSLALVVGRASAIPLPDFPAPPTPKPTERDVPGLVREQPLALEAGAEKECKDVRTKGFCLRHKLALNLDYLHSEQDLRTGYNGQTFTATAKLNTFTTRLEYHPFEVLSVYGIAGIHDGSSKVAGSDLKSSLDGWLAGAGITAFFPVPLSCEEGDAVCLTPGAIVDFNYTYNEYDDVKNGIDVYNVTTRAALLGGTSEKFGFGFWAGPAYQSVEPDQKISLGGQTVTVHVRPRERWNGVIGAVVKSVVPGLEMPLSLTVEGGVGNRTQILVSLRGEFLR